MNFDQIIAIDWSGADVLKTKSIALAHAYPNQSEVGFYEPKYGPLWSRQSVFEFIVEQSGTDNRTFIGIDANLSYAATVVKKHLENPQNAFDLWARVDELCKNNTNFFAKDFWIHPDIKNDFWIKGRNSSKKIFPQRQTEIMCASQGYGYPESPFKFIGPKQVGKGGLSAMRLCHALRLQLREKIAFWPLSSQTQLDKATIIIAEIYPRLFIKTAGLGSKKIRTHEDLIKTLSVFGGSILKGVPLTDHQTDAAVSACGINYLLSNETNLLSVPKMIDPAIQLEGWILGVNFALAP